MESREGTGKPTYRSGFVANEPAAPRSAGQAPATREGAATDLAVVPCGRSPSPRGWWRPAPRPRVVLCCSSCRGPCTISDPRQRGRWAPAPCVAASRPPASGLAPRRACAPTAPCCLLLCEAAAAALLLYEGGTRCSCSCLLL